MQVSIKKLIEIKNRGDEEFFNDFFDKYFS
jgi:hypothetical protein